MNDMIRRLRPLVLWLISKHVSRWQPWYADVESACMEALWDAVRSWTPGGAASLRVWVRRRVAGAVIDALRRFGPQRRAQRSLFTDVRDELTQANGGIPPTKTEVFAIGKERTQSAAYGHNAFTPPRPVLMRDIAARWPEDVDVEALIVGGDIDGDGVDARDFVDWLLGQLPEREETALRMYWLEGAYMREIGEALGCSESRISQILGGAMDALRRIAASCGLQIDDDLTAKSVCAALWQRSTTWEGPKLLVTEYGR